MCKLKIMKIVMIISPIYKLIQYMDMIARTTPIKFKVVKFSLKKNNPMNMLKMTTDKLLIIKTVELATL